MIKLFMITLLFCLPQHFSLIKSLIFLNFGNYSFVCNYCTVCGLRINYDFFERYLVVLSKNQKIMALLPFIFCWRKYIFLMIIQIFIKTFFPLIFFLIPWAWLTLHFLAFGEIYIQIIYWWPSKYTKNIKWGWMGLNDTTWRIFPEIDQKLSTSVKISHER